MAIQPKHVYIEKGVKRCTFLGRRYPQECSRCSHVINIFCGCEYEDYNGEGLG